MLIDVIDNIRYKRKKGEVQIRDKRNEMIRLIEIKDQ